MSDHDHGKVHGHRFSSATAPVAIALVCALARFAAPGTAAAGDPSLARYSDDPSRTFWFLQISDLHIDTFLYGSEEDQLEWALGAGFDAIQPFFVVATGDLTDHTNGFNYLGAPNPEEWNLLNSILAGAGMGPDVYFDVPGNHDFYGDDGGFYLTYGVQALVQGTTQPEWTLDLPFGLYHFVSAATAHNDDPPLPWPFDNVAVSDAEAAEIEANLLGHTDARLTIMFGHHDFEAAAGGGALRSLMLDHGVAHYGHGHVHDMNWAEGSGILRFRCGSMGQQADVNVCVWAVDNDTVSWGVTDAGSPWPAAVIPAPAAARLGSSNDIVNPYAPSVPAACSAAPIRVLAFDGAGVSEVLANVDGGALSSLVENPATPNQWTGTFDATLLTPGVHALDVQVGGTEWRHFVSEFTVVDEPCVFDPLPETDDAEPAPDTSEPLPDEPPDATTDPAPDAETAEDAPADVPADMAADSPADVPADTEEEDDGGEVTGCGCSLAS